MKNFMFFSLGILMCIGGKAQKYDLNSPDGKLTTEVEVNQSITVKFLKNNNLVLSLGGISLQTIGGKQPFANLAIKKVNRKSVDEEVKPLIRDKSDTYKNCFNELTVVFK